MLFIANTLSVPPVVTVSERSPKPFRPLTPTPQVDVDLGSGVVKIEGLLAVEQAVEAIQRQGYVIAAVLPSEAGTPAAPAVASSCCGGCHR